MKVTITKDLINQVNINGKEKLIVDFISDPITGMEDRIIIDYPTTKEHVQAALREKILQRKKEQDEMRQQEMKNDAACQALGIGNDSLKLEIDCQRELK